MNTYSMHNLSGAKQSKLQFIVLFNQQVMSFSWENNSVMHWKIWKESTVVYFRVMSLHLSQEAKKITKPLISRPKFKPQT